MERLHSVFPRIRVKAPLFPREMALPNGRLHRLRQLHTFWGGPDMLSNSILVHSHDTCDGAAAQLTPRYETLGFPPNSICEFHARCQRLQSISVGIRSSQVQRNRAITRVHRLRYPIGQSQQVNEQRAASEAGVLALSEYANEHAALPKIPNAVCYALELR